MKKKTFSGCALQSFKSIFFTASVYIYTAFLDSRCTMNKKQCEQYLECKSFILFNSKLKYIKQDFAFLILSSFHLHEIHSLNFKNPQQVGFFKNCMLIVLLVKKKKKKKLEQKHSALNIFFSLWHYMYELGEQIVIYIIRMFFLVVA